MRIGIFGGSFDPVHQEHISLARAAIKGLSLDKLIVMPAGVPPHKQGKRLASGEDRLAMCRLAFSGIEQVDVSDYEIKKEGASYTYLTCEYFKNLYPEAELFWLVGTDMFWNFFHWKNPERILTYVTLAVCRRNEGEDNIKGEQEAFYGRFGKRFAVIPYNGKPVSSTQIRTRAALGLELLPYTTDKVADYITENKLYLNERAIKGLSLEKPSRAEHSKRVALLAMEKAERYQLDKEKVFLAAALHDVGKNLRPEDALLKGFVPPENVPLPVLHQYSGAYVLEHAFGITDQEILNAVRYHTSGRAGMSDLEKLIFLADMLEAGRDFPHVDELRREFDHGLDHCMYCCLSHQLHYLQSAGGEIYPLTLAAYEYYKKIEEEKK